jgi:hypothetical protein
MTEMPASRTISGSTTATGRTLGNSVVEVELDVLVEVVLVLLDVEMLVEELELLLELDVLVLDDVLVLEVVLLLVDELVVVEVAASPHTHEPPSS